MIDYGPTVDFKHKFIYNKGCLSKGKYMKKIILFLALLTINTDVSASDPNDERFWLALTYTLKLVISLKQEDLL